MLKKYSDDNKNIIKIDGKFTKIKNLSSNIIVVLNGKNNVLTLNSINGPGRLYVEINGDDNVVNFGKDNLINNNVFIVFPMVDGKKVKNVSVIIGNNNFFNGSNIGFIAPMISNNFIKLGNYNLLASNILFRGRNDHIIYDKSTKSIINVEKSIFIGNKNWICDNVEMLPKTNISDNNVIALGSIINNVFEQSNTLIAGIPAKVKKQNIAWSRAPELSKIDYTNPINIKEE